MASAARVCKFFNTQGGCLRRDKCLFLHQESLCRFYRAGKCRFHSGCRFKHVEPDANGNTVEIKHQGGKMDKELIKDSVIGDVSNGNEPKLESLGDKHKLDTAVQNTKGTSGEDHGVCVPQISSSDHQLTSTVGTDPEVTGTEGATSSAKDANQNNQSEGAPAENGENPESIKSVICGECGKMIELSYKSADDTCGSEDITGDDDDDEEELDELEEHYMEMMIKFDEKHLKFLHKSRMFNFPTSCGVCGKHFNKSRSLLRHITDKVKNKKNSSDRKRHKSFLSSIIMAFAGRDVGLDDEKEMMDSLLRHLVSSYTGDSGDESDDPESSAGGLVNMLGLITYEDLLTKKTGPSSGPDDTTFISDDSFTMGEFDEDDMFELACQGIKPWDPEAGMALAVLNGYF